MGEASPRVGSWKNLRLWQQRINQNLNGSKRNRETHFGQDQYEKVLFPKAGRKMRDAQLLESV